MNKTLFTFLFMPLLTVAHDHLIPESPFSGVQEEHFVSTYVPKKPHITLFSSIDPIGSFGRIFYANGTQGDIFLNTEEFASLDFKNLDSEGLFKSNLPYIIKFGHLFNKIAVWNQNISVEQKKNLIMLALANGIDINTALYFYEYRKEDGLLKFRKITLYSECDEALREFLVSHGANKDYMFYPDWYLRLNAYSLFGTHLS